MFDVLDRQTTLTGNQKKIIGAAIIGDALEFFDYFLISYVLAFVAMVFGAMNVVGGYVVTDRMLQMFRKKPAAPRPAETDAEA